MRAFLVVLMWLVAYAIGILALCGLPYLLSALVVVLFLPWLWMSFLVPMWATAISLALVPLAALVAIGLVMHDLNAEDDSPVEGEERYNTWRKRTAAHGLAAWRSVRHLDVEPKHS